jgi:hypothetical protein
VHCVPTIITSSRFIGFERMINYWKFEEVNYEVGIGSFLRLYSSKTLFKHMFNIRKNWSRRGRMLWRSSLELGGATRVSLWRFGGKRTIPSVSTKIWKKRIERDLLKSANQKTLPRTVSTWSGFDRRTSLTTTSATPVMLENRGSGNKRMKDWPRKILRIHMTNFVDDWHHLCVPILSWQSWVMSASIARAPQRWLKGPWGRAVKT